MRVSNWPAIGLLTIAVASASGQARDYKDTYTASDAGKPTAPAKALDVMLTQLETEVLGVAQAMPAEKYGFAPTAETFAPGSPAKYGNVRTFAAQLTHIAGANYHFYSQVSGTTPPAASKQVRDLKTKDEILAALKQSFAYGHAQIMTITPQNAFIGIEGLDGFHTPATVAAFAVAHGYDHYGQLVEYLRMNGVVPPGSN
jgi:uncharacterized damage-inducible protein DinB